MIEGRMGWTGATKRLLILTVIAAVIIVLAAKYFGVLSGPVVLSG